MFVKRATAPSSVLDINTMIYFSGLGYRRSKFLQQIRFFANITFQQICKSGSRPTKHDI